METSSQLKTLSSPEGIKGLWALLGMLGFWHHHIPVFVLVVSPLYNLLKKWLVWHWDEVHERAL